MPVFKQILRTNEVLLPERHPAVTSAGGLRLPYYSQAVRTPRLLFIGGLVGTKGQSAELADPSMERQTEQLLENMKAILAEAGLTLAHVVRVVVFIRDRSEFQKMNSVYVRYFPENAPSRTCSTVADMYPGARVQMSAIASYEPKTSVQPPTVTAPELHPSLVALPTNQRRPFYSQALKTQSFMFLSGIVGTDPGNSHITEQSFEGQARKTLDNVQRILESGGLTMDSVVSLLALLQDQGDVPRLQALFSSYFPNHKPPQCCVTEGDHFPASKIEILATAAYDPDRQLIATDRPQPSASPSLRASPMQAQAVKAHGLVFVTGLTGVAASSGDDGIEHQTRRTMDALDGILRAAGASMADVVSTTIFLKSRSDFQAMNRVYGEYFPKDPPARSCATMYDLQPGARLEMVAIASCKT
jgi:2-iminobutanoate/2-iminopropanoate deaminase